MNGRSLQDRRGFTLIELLVVTILLGILATLGLLKFTDLRHTARVAAVAGDIRALVVGAFNYHAEAQTWPPESGAGVIPPGLGPYLPGLNMNGPYYTLDWENPGGGGGGFQVGVTVTSSDPRFVAKLVRNLGSQFPFFVAGSSVTYIIVDANGKF